LLYPFDEWIVLKEVILGPRCELPVESLRALFGSIPGEVSIIRSRLATQSFHVVEVVE
jgi:hypothetical protein